MLCPPLSECYSLDSKPRWTPIINKGAIVSHKQRQNAKFFHSKITNILNSTNQRCNYISAKRLITPLIFKIISYYLIPQISITFAVALAVDTLIYLQALSV